ncbi:MAG: hypothetical protein BWY92_00226 [Firmicutes bacterium ADurb.BinA052]|jgi:hypothetical protein|nr:MAG: hypothetical protein BWY92_00226 [Firmicutes bacterium ADurb.BinA052]
MTVAVLATVGAVAIAQIMGSALHWRWFADPPEEWSPLWPYSQMKRLFGKNGLILFNYASGILMLAVDIFLLVVWLSGRVTRTRLR